jgi:hypothetical protein
MNNGVWFLSAMAGLLIWLAQKRVEMKMKVFDEAVIALLRYQAEAIDQELQNKHYILTDSVRRSAPYVSNETGVLMVRSTALVDEFFSPEVSSAFTKAMDSVRFGESSDQMGGPIIDDCLSLPELQKMIKDLSKELTITHILKTWLRQAAGCCRR